MNQGANSSAVSYGAFRNRFKQVTSGADPTTTIYVAGLLEKVTRSSGTEFRHQVHGPGGVVAIVNCSGSTCNPAATTSTSETRSSSTT